MAAFSFVEARFRFGRGVFSLDGSTGADFSPRQFPLTGSMQNELMTRSACVPCLVDAVCQKTSLTGPVRVSR